MRKFSLFWSKIASLVVIYASIKPLLICRLNVLASFYHAATAFELGPRFISNKKGHQGPP